MLNQRIRDLVLTLVEKTPIQEFSDQRASAGSIKKLFRQMLNDKNEAIQILSWSYIGRQSLMDFKPQLEETAIKSKSPIVRQVAQFTVNHFNTSGVAYRN